MKRKLVASFESGMNDVDVRSFQKDKGTYYHPIDMLVYLNVDDPERVWDDIKKENNPLFKVYISDRYQMIGLEMVTFAAIKEILRRYPPNTLEQKVNLNKWLRIGTVLGDTPLFYPNPYDKQREEKKLGIKGTP